MTYVVRGIHSGDRAPGVRVVVIDVLEVHRDAGLGGRRRLRVCSPTCVGLEDVADGGKFESVHGREKVISYGWGGLLLEESEGGIARYRKDVLVGDSSLLALLFVTIALS